MASVCDWDRVGRIRRQKAHTLRKVACVVCERTIKTFDQHLIQRMKYCSDECRQQGRRRQKRSRYNPEARRRQYLAAREEFLARQRRVRGINREERCRKRREQYDPAERRRQYLVRREQVLASQQASRQANRDERLEKRRLVESAWTAEKREQERRRGRERARRDAAIKTGKRDCAQSGFFLLIYDRAGYWRAGQAGTPIAREEQIMARYELCEEGWRARPPVVATGQTLRQAERLTRMEERA